MDLGLYQPPARVVGFTYSHPERDSTLNCSETATSKLVTQRSLLSELLAAQLLGGDEDEERSGSYDDEETGSDEDVEDPANAPPARQSTYGQLMPSPSEPISIPCSGSMANQRVKDAYKRLLHQRQMEQLYQQQLLRLQQQRLAQQQQAMYQQSGHVPNVGHAAQGPAMPQGPQCHPAGAY
ncbi:hypothetical protein GPECTOR_3g473 [Gonium pectorale]|uniref:Uncharacterized protein n=1 Tax=Gonium pectorale TaxID=33097 RepID=A0A150H035_GONPE|nr:hypothetical protein GPECTOR_3g473 [Gonium pectorale]|eukprot:KXZ55342.1 hypothetical protein GPECTOR_3g473 [Gonium pectorale]